MENIVLNTKCGQIEGINNKNEYVFKGIKYATANRFERPIEITSWDGIYDAKESGACCYQYRGFEDEKNATGDKAFYFKEFRQNATFTYSEDCLFLNIYTPIDAKNAPVLINFHGGAFTEGSNNEPQFDGREYTARGVIYVNVNYRLNVYGFYASSKTGGNFGVYDSICAINWVYNNIEAFGGDKDNITLMGQSAGAMMVQTMIDSPLINDKFKRAIMTSGGGRRRILLPYRNIKNTYKYWKGIASQFDDVKLADKKELFYAWKKSSFIKNLFSTAPMMDGEAIVAKKNKPIKPCIIGYLTHDIFPPEIVSMADKYAKACKKEGLDCFVFRFDHTVPGDDRINYHSANLWYENGTFDRSWRPFTQVDLDLSKKMIDMYVSFIKTNNPNTKDFNGWNSYKSKKDLYIFE